MRVQLLEILKSSVLKFPRFPNFQILKPILKSSNPYILKFDHWAAAGAGTMGGSILQGVGFHFEPFGSRLNCVLR